MKHKMLRAFLVSLGVGLVINWILGNRSSLLFLFSTGSGWAPVIARAGLSLLLFAVACVFLFRDMTRQEVFLSSLIPAGWSLAYTLLYRALLALGWLGVGGGGFALLSLLNLPSRGYSSVVSLLTMAGQSTGIPLDAANAVVAPLLPLLLAPLARVRPPESPAAPVPQPVWDGAQWVYPQNGSPAAPVPPPQSPLDPSPPADPGQPWIPGEPANHPPPPDPDPQDPWLSGEDMDGPPPQ